MVRARLWLRWRCEPVRGFERRRRGDRQQERRQEREQERRFEFEFQRRWLQEHVVRVFQRVVLLVVLGALAGGCNDDDDPADAAPPDLPCGPGAPTLELGRDQPFVENPEQRYRIEAGTQGGFHVHVSLRVVGAADPDHADIELRLKLGDRALASHVNQDWLLTIEPGGCEYPNARLILLDEEGGLLPEERLPELTGTPLRLTAGVNTPLGNARALEMVTLELP